MTGVQTCALPICDPFLGVSVTRGRGAAAVEVDDGADVGDVAACSVEGVVDGEDVACGKAVLPLDDHAYGDGCLKSGSGEAASDGPHAGRVQVAVDINPRFSNGEAVEGDLLFGIAAWNVSGCRTGSVGSGDSGDGQRVENGDRKSTRLNSSHRSLSRMPSSA